jgi:isoquinoline 1-oxidoreductase beta subunit
MNTLNVSRRNFLRSSAVVGGGLVVGFSLSGCSETPLPIDTTDGAFVPNAFLQILPDNTIKFYTARDEMGQGVTTGLSTLLGEELDVDPLDMEILLAGVHPDYNNPGMGVQGTGGSNSINAHYTQLRQAGANTRALIVDAAVKDLAVSRDSIKTDNGYIVVDNERYPYGDFVATASTLTAPTEAPMKSPSEFLYIGRESPRVDAIAKATGTAEFGIDVDIPDMHHAVVVRSPVAGAKLLSVDKRETEQMPGVTDIIEIGSGVAVVARKYWQATTAAKTLKPKWEDVPLAKVDTSTLREDYQAAMANEEGTIGPDDGDLDAAFDSAAKVVEGEYWTPFLAHAPLEPMNAVVRIENGEAEVWSGTQGPPGAQGLVSRYSGIPPEKVRVHQTYLGGSFGRRGTLTHIIEATEIAVASKKPIQLLWSREDDLRHGLYRPASLMKLKASVDSDGKITAWKAKRVGGNISPDTLKNMLPALFPGLGDGTVNWMVGFADSTFEGWMSDPSSIEGLFEDYDHPNTRVEHTTINHGLPLTFWRSVGHSYTAFAKESMIDELALAAGMDEVAFRLQNTKNNPRLHNVIKVAGEEMKKMQPAEGRFLGFAAHHSFLTDVAEVAEISIEGNKIKVHKVTCVVDCGRAVNPDIVRAQMEGGIVFGLTAALYGNLELENGAIKESNFHDYPMLRMNEAPAIEVVIIDQGTEPTGVGEPGLPPIAPAVANAVFRATGKRLRSLPLKLA